MAPMAYGLYFFVIYVENMRSFQFKLEHHTRTQNVGRVFASALRFPSGCRRHSNSVAVPVRVP